MLNSVWSETCPLPSFPPLNGDTKTDVLIIGGGLAGILTAYMLHQAGIDYLLVEADRICRGITRNTTAKVTSQHGLIYNKLLKEFGTEQAKLYWEAHEAALSRYRNLAKEIPCDFETKDSYIYSVKHPEKLSDELDALTKLGIDSTFVEELPLPFSVVGAVQFRNQAQFHPLKFIAGIAPNLNIRERTPVRSFSGNTVLTNTGKIEASNIIVATHFPINNKHGFYFLKMYQDRSYVLGLEQAPDLNGMYLDEAEHGLSFRNYNGLLLLGGGGHRTGKEGGNWAVLERTARQYYPQAQVKYHWSAQDCMTLDGVPYIGQYSKGTPNLYVATGFNKWGMTSSMVAATLLCDRIQEKENPYAEVFSPSRSIWRRQLFTNVGESASHLLTFSKPRCPHMGCTLVWNPQEHSWDCPCHGSRFTEDGKLLDNPATRNLNKKLRGR